MSFRSGAALLIAAFILTVMIPQHSLASTEADAGSGDPFQQLLQKADASLAIREKKKADFYIARYLGLMAVKKRDANGVTDLEGVLKKRKLTPKAFLPGDWDAGFVDWFEKAVYPRWGAEESRVREKARSFEIAYNSLGGKYFVTVVAYPELEMWYLLEDGVSTRRLILPMGAVADRPTIFFGKTFKNMISFQAKPLYLDTQKRRLHYVWTPEFSDMDGDGIQEVWLRYNLSWGNGFAQVLECYRIHNDSELKLLRRFQSEMNGIARHLPDGRVETGTARGDRYDFKTWKYEKKEFKIVSEEDRPFLLKSNIWKEYFLE